MLTDWPFSTVRLDRPVPFAPGSTEVISSPGAAMLTHGPHTENADTDPVCGLTEATDSTSSAYTGGACTWLTWLGLGRLFCCAFWQAEVCWPFWSGSCHWMACCRRPR